MKTDPNSPSGRQRIAGQALHELGAHRSDHQRLAVQCRHSHHLAFVYETPAGLVYVAHTGPHAHGSKDFVDVPHHGSHPSNEYADLLKAQPHADDALPAWCDCGPHTLSRAQLLKDVAAGPATVHVS